MIRYNQPTCTKCKMKIKFIDGAVCGCGFLRITIVGNLWEVAQGRYVESMPIDVPVTIRTNLK